MIKCWQGYEGSEVRCTGMGVLGCEVAVSENAEHLQCGLVVALLGACLPGTDLDGSSVAESRSCADRGSQTIARHRACASVCTHSCETHAEVWESAHL